MRLFLAVLGAPLLLAIRGLDTAWVWPLRPNIELLDFGLGSTPEGLRQAMSSASRKTRGCGIAGNAKEAVRLLQDDEVLACFLDGGVQGEEVRAQWQEALTQIPLFEATSEVTLGDEVDAAILQSWPPELHASGRFRDLGHQTLALAKKLLKVFYNAGSVSFPSRQELQVRVRLASLDRVQCSRLHWDDVPLRLVCTLAGAGTQVLPEACADRRAFANLRSMPGERQVSMTAEDWNDHIVSSSSPSWLGGGWRSRLLQVPAGWAVLLKGSAWDTHPSKGYMRASPGALHRSPEACKRVLLQVDFVNSVAGGAGNLDERAS